MLQQKQEKAALEAQMCNKIILALDQSTQKTGWCIFRDNKLYKYGKLDPKGELMERILTLRDWVKDTIGTEKIDLVGIEEIQLQQIPGTKRDVNVATFKKLAYVQAILIELCIDLGIKYEIVPSTRWKSHLDIRGSKRAEQKKSAQEYITKKYGITPTQDECDAICIGLYLTQEKNNGLDWT